MRLLDYERIVFFTGAGLSAESGIPTYRGKGGIWAEYDYEDYACQRAFDRDPDKVWDFHDKRRAAVAACEPHLGHRVVTAVKAQKPKTTIITQNIDGMHQRAGAAEVIELHGSLWRVRCDDCGVVRADMTMPLRAAEGGRHPEGASNNPRRCSCGAHFRPDIVWFEDSLDARNIQRAQEALADCDLLVSVGTSAVVYPAAELPRIAVARGAATIEVNLEDTPMSRLYQHRLRGKASEVLAELARGMAV
jgi:NAD-dependent deacetylase